ncbi:MAG TPA: MBL fold metallo-hydrolase [Chloroflexota bacterium]|jgi:glyoxylase-like metal-dependent hydrolase (beta-lactamase superfamily II)
MPRLTRVIAILGLLALLLALVPPAAALADDDASTGRPPQVIPQGFESTDQLQRDAARSERAPMYSAWIVESSRFMGVPFGAFMPDRAFVPGSTNPRNSINTVDLPVNVGIIKGPDGTITLYDSGWKQLHYIFDLNTSCCWKDLRDQLRAIGLRPADVTRIVIGHGHWDHAGQLSSFPNATLFVQKEELKAIDFFLNYPTEFNGGHIRAVNTDRIGCARTPACGYPPQTVQEILGKVLADKARIVDGRHEVAPGLIIHPAFRGHTYGSQLLQVHTARGELMFGSDTYSSWEGIRDWNVANIQQTDSVQQFLAYEKCYVVAGSQGFNNCVAAHEPLSYSRAYPLTSNWWNIPNGNCSRAAELTLAPGQSSLVPAAPDRTPPSSCVSTVPPH